MVDKRNYEYYNDGRLYKVKHEANPDDWREYTYEYDDAGRLLRIEYPGGMHAHFTKPEGSPGWDANGQLLCLRYVRGNGSHFYSFEYQYDESGNRVQMVESPEDSNDAITWDYQYDWLNRLVGVTRNGNPWRFYVYDESDNRIELSWPEDPENDPYQLTTWSYSHDEGDQLLSYSLVDGVNTQLIEEFTYDEDGNMIVRVKDSQTTHYDWDHNNRLKRIRPDGQDPRYLHYDAGGIRDKRTLSGQKETFHTLSGVALADVRPTGPVAFVQGHQLLGLVKDGDLYHFISDGLGTVRWVTDDAVNPVASFTCDPFGNPDPGGTSGNPDFLQHTYTGALGVRNDGAALGLYYAQQRYYDADLGRWLTPDPIGFSGGPNLYAYADNDPTGRVDPVGNSPWVAWAIIGLAAEAYNHLSGYYEQLNNPANNQVRVNGLSLWEGGAYQRFPLEIQLFGASRFRFGRKCPQKTLTVGRWMSRAEYNTIIRTGRLPQRITGGNVVHVTCPPNSAGFTPKPGSMFVKFDVPSSQFRMNDPSKGWGRVFGPGSIEAKLAQRKGQPVPRELPEVTNIQILEEP